MKEIREAQDFDPDELTGLQGEEILLGTVTEVKGSIHGALSHEIFSEIAVSETKHNHLRELELQEEIRKFLKKYPNLDRKIRQEEIRRMRIGFGIAKIRGRLRGKLNGKNMCHPKINTLVNQMSSVRILQDKNGLLGKNLITDLTLRLDRNHILKDRGYKIRYYSALGTLLDHAGGFDFWVELYDSKNNTVLDTFKIDVTFNDRKINGITEEGESGCADYIFHYLREHFDVALDLEANEFRWVFDEKFFQSENYRNLLSEISRKFQPHLADSG